MRTKHVQIIRGKTYLIKNEMQKIRSINHYNFKIIMQPEHIKFKKPKESVKNCILNNHTYAIRIYIPVQIKYKNTRIFESAKK
jgi:hypothetical protein